MIIDLILPGWLMRVIDWTVHSVTAAEFYRDASRQRSGKGTSSLAKSYLDDVTLMFQKVRIVYATLDNNNDAEDEFAQQEMTDRPVSMLPQNKVILAPINENGFATNNQTKTSPLRRHATVTATTTKPRSASDSQSSSATSSLLDGQPKSRLLRLIEINQDPYGSILSLLVAVYTTLTLPEFTKLAPHLWERFVDDRKKAFSPGAFLFIQCGERVPKVATELITQDLYRYSVSLCVDK
ncbi:hypothetical protein BC938DRAFT_475719 [Jimgerdemannia flammicorona]|uniref:Uncharacterized protein n=1 Tax=Jimgerdemannia flammicorona TaxID=994334 RepID=A0A433PPM0_9FUNG|nr:hypothetical protein BC938DRAFT_475719 [Jimgerdemannia flammicorona]